jgi:hypothetical protein
MGLVREQWFFIQLNSTPSMLATSLGPSRSSLGLGAGGTSSSFAMLLDQFNHADTVASQEVSIFFIA